MSNKKKVPSRKTFDNYLFMVEQVRKAGVNTEFYFYNSGSNFEPRTKGHVCGISCFSGYKSSSNGKWYPVISIHGYKPTDKTALYVPEGASKYTPPVQPSLFDISSNTRSPNTVQGVTGEQAIQLLDQMVYIMASSGLAILEETKKLEKTKPDEQQYILGMIHTDITVYTDREYNKEVMNRTGVTPDDVLRLGYDDLLMEHNKQYSSRLRAKAMGKAITSYWYVRAYIKDLNVLRQLHDVSAKLARGEN